jgi:hypothetical protein
MGAAHGTSFQQKQCRGRNAGGGLMDVPNVLCSIVMKTIWELGLIIIAYTVFQKDMLRQNKAKSNSSVFWDMTLRSPIKVNRRFGVYLSIFKFEE